MPQGLLEGFKIGQELIPSISDAVHLQGMMARSQLYSEYAKEAQQNREIQGQFAREFGQQGAVPKTPLAAEAQPEQQSEQPWSMVPPAPQDPRDVALQKWNQGKADLQQQMMRLTPYVGRVPIAKSQYDVLDKQYKEKERVEKEAETDIKDFEKRISERLDRGWINARQAKQEYIDHISADPILDMKYGKHAKDVQFGEKGLETTVTYTSDQLQQIEKNPDVKQALTDVGLTNIKPGQKITLSYTHTGNPERPIKYNKAKVEPDSTEGKNQTEEQLIDTALHDPDPAKRKRAKETLDAIQGRKVALVEREARVRKDIKKEEEGGYTMADAPEAMKRVAQLVSQYKYPAPTGWAIRSPYWQNVLSLAQEIDPSFDGTQYNARLNVKKAFTSGKEAQNITGLNTAVGHINSLVKAAKELNNSNWPSANYATNVLSKYLPITPGLVERQGKITAVKTKFNAVKGEMASIFKRSGATDTEIKSWQDTVDDPTTATKGMWANFISGSLELMGSRIGALQDQWEKGIGKPKDFHFLSPASRSILGNMGVDVNKIDPVAEGAKEEGGPVSRSEYFKAMKARNPNATDAEINAHLDAKGIR